MPARNLFASCSASSRPHRTGRLRSESIALGAPPPAMIPLYALGYIEDGEGRKHAFVVGAQRVFEAREAETFDKSYRVLKITPTYIEVEDQRLDVQALAPLELDSVIFWQNIFRHFDFDLCSCGSEAILKLVQLSSLVPAMPG